MSAGRFTGRPQQRRVTGLESELIARLRTLPPGPAPSPAFRSDLRAQLVSITSRIVAESVTEDSAADYSAALLPVRTAARRSASTLAGLLSGLRKPALALTSAAAVLALLIGAAVWMSGGSLPGDSLYGVKRASENVQLSMAGNTVSKGYTYLGFATTRADEIAKLLGTHSALGAVAAGPGPRVTEAAGGISGHTASLVTSTLATADSDSRSGMQLLGKATVAQMSADPLAKLFGWVSDQRARLAQAAAQVPRTNPLSARFAASTALLNRIDARATQLKAALGCACLSQANSDDLGPIPCNRCGLVPGKAPSAVPSGSPSRSGGTGSGGTGSGGTASGGNGPAGGGSASVGSTGTATGGSAAGGAGVVPGSGGQIGGSLPGVPGAGSPSGSTVPSVPTGALPLPSSPISVGSGGVGITLPSATVSVGTGGISASLPGLPPVKIPGLLGVN